jgi:glycogen operon protein
MPGEAQADAARPPAPEGAGRLGNGPSSTREALIGFVASLIRLRREHPTFRRRDFFGGRTGAGAHGVRWLRPDGQDMTEAQWEDPQARCVGMLIGGAALSDTDRRGMRLTDDDFLLLFNAHHEDVEFLLPEGGDRPWLQRVDTTHPAPPARMTFPPGATYLLQGRSLAVLSRPMTEK